jgi:FixJ family two-component response regulator
MSGAPVVFVVDDDPSVRSSLKFLLSTVGLQIESFVSAASFLQRKRTSLHRKTFVSRLSLSPATAIFQ